MHDFLTEKKIKGNKLKEKIKKHFSKSAVTYDENAALQRGMGDRLIAMIKSVEAEPAAILDIGAGTARDAIKLAKIYQGAKIVACDIAHGMMRYAKNAVNGGAPAMEFVTADMERLPFANGGFDVVCSNAAAHWSGDLSKALTGIRPLLKTGGVLCFSTFGTDTLDELSDAYSKAYEYFHKAPKESVNRFTPFCEVIKALRRAGFSNIKSEVKQVRVRYESAARLFGALKAIGSHKSVAGVGLTGKGFLKKVFEIYENSFSDGDGVFATYEVYYFMCGE